MADLLSQGQDLRRNALKKISALSAVSSRAQPKSSDFDRLCRACPLPKKGANDSNGEWTLSLSQIRMVSTSGKIIPKFH